MSSVVKPLACRAGRREFDSWNRTNTQRLKTTVEEDTVLPLPCKRLDLRVARKTTQNGDPVSMFAIVTCVLKILTLKSLSFKARLNAKLLI